MDKTRLHIINRITNCKLLLAGLVCAIAFFASTTSLSGQCTLACNDQLEINLNEGGFFHVTTTLLFQGSISNCTNLGVELYDENQNYIGDTLTCAQVGTIVAARLYNYDNNAFCETDLIVVDKNSPVFTCPDLFIACNGAVDPDSIGYPLVTDNCTSFDHEDLSYSDQIMDLDCFEAINGVQVTARIDRTWLVTDNSGNQGQCVQAIYLERATLNDVVFPSSLTGVDAITCGTDDPNDFTLTGVPLIEGRQIDPNGLCDISILYNDQVFNSCGGSTTTFRKWLALDGCTNTTKEFDQIIELKDKFGPEITCPEDVTINANSFSCDATVTLPTLQGTDECSAFTITPSWEFGQGPGPFNGVPVGQHLVTYTATDACNNTTVCTYNITIVDNSPPTPLCINSINVSLLPTGVARIFAVSFDEGSFDNCGIDRYEVRRDTNPFGGFVDFSCEDIFNGPVLVHLRAYDINGLFNDCWIEVTVRDNFSPSITCPATVTVECEDDRNDLALVGIPTFSDACGVDTIYYADTENLNCGVGTVQRRWTVEDIHGNTNFCIQTINVEDNSFLSITYPDDITVDFCTGTTDESFTGTPFIKGEGCKNILTNKEDQTFSSSTYCYTIFRTWTVINWCVYDPNSGSNEGEYTHVQRIDVIDNSAPVITCVADTTILNFTNDCSAVYVDLSAPTAIDCSGFSSIRNNSPYADSIEGDASGNYPNGIHVVEYTAFDNCGNATECEQTIEVRDGLSPNLICKSGVVVDIPQNGSISIAPSLLIASVSDNCTSSNLLTFDLFPNTFTCDDIGLQTVSLVAVDLEGNSSVCTTTIDVQDNLFTCAPPEVDISGRLLNVRGEPVENMEVVANGTYFSTTDADGYYTLQNLPAGVDYSVNVTDVMLERRGISTFDMVLIVAHILQTRTLTDPYKIIAVDIDNSSSVSVLDIVGIRQLILEQVNQFSSGIAWKCVDENYTFLNSSNPLGENYLMQIDFVNLNQDINNADFRAIKLGDIDGDGANLTDNAIVERNQNEISLLVNSERLVAGETKEIEFGLAEKMNIYGLQFDMNINSDLADYISLESDEELSINESNLVYDASKNKLKMSWNTIGDSKSIEKGQGIFKITVRVKKNCNVQDLFTITQKEFRSEIYDEAFNKFDLTLRKQHIGEPVEVEKISMEQNYPNPVITNTYIKIDADKNSNAEIVLTNIDGKNVYVKNIRLNSGDNIIELNTSNFKSEKYMNYSLVIDGLVIDTKKMIMVCP